MSGKTVRKKLTDFAWRWEHHLISSCCIRHRHHSCSAAATAAFSFVCWLVVFSCSYLAATQHTHTHAQHELAKWNKNVSHCCAPHQMWYMRRLNMIFLFIVICGTQTHEQQKKPIIRSLFSPVVLRCSFSILPFESNRDTMQCNRVRRQHTAIHGKHGFTTAEEWAWHSIALMLCLSACVSFFSFQHWYCYLSAMEH